MDQLKGVNNHHIAEAAFKACGVALRRAIAPGQGLLKPGATLPRLNALVLQFAIFIDQISPTKPTVSSNDLFRQPGGAIPKPSLKLFSESTFFSGELATSHLIQVQHAAFSVAEDS